MKYICVFVCVCVCVCVCVQILVLILSHSITHCYVPKTSCTANDAVHITGQKSQIFARGDCIIIYHLPTKHF